MPDIAAIQSALREFQLDGWLLYDFRGINVLARRVVGLPSNAHLSRRWFYYIPATGEPRKLVHNIEPASLAHLPGSATVYLRWQELEAGVGAMVRGTRRVAMEYSPRNGNPYISRVDAGTIELVRSFGTEVVPSGDLISMFEARWDDEQIKSHFEAAVHTRSAYDVAFAFLAERIRTNGSVTEIEVQDRIMAHFASNGLTTDHPPIVGAGPHSGDPHYAPAPATQATIRAGDFVLIDLWAKMNRPRAVYSDLTRTCYLGPTVPTRYVEIFNIVAAARDAGIQCVRDAFAHGRTLVGGTVDDAVRGVIEKAGYGKYYGHRTGHSIGEEVHGNGAHIDNLETCDGRRILPRTCFSIEPGIYLPEFGVRSEVDVFIDADGGVHVTGGDPQTEIHAINV